jgi:diguanylate cyclase (GGDEF)-like protein/PAS domain S-box-containing protein
MMRLTGKLRTIMQRISLMPKMLIITVFMGGVVWVALDYVKTNHLKGVFEADLNQKLNKYSQEDRIRFDNHVGAYQQAVKLIVSQRSFYDYVNDKSSFPDRASAPIHHSEIPQWLPDPSVIRKFVRIHYALLIDSKSRVREVYRGLPEPPPKSLLQPSDILRQLSHNQSFMTTIDGMPFLVTSASVTDKRGKSTATLMIAAHLDGDFLTSSQGLTANGRIVALAGGEDIRIIASNRPDLLHEGVLLNALRDRYLITGKSFFDWGASDLVLQFTSFMPKTEYKKLTESILAWERLRHAIIAVSLILSFVLIMFWLTRHIQRLTRNITDSSQKILNMQPGDIPKGDQLIILESQFNDFAKEIVEARERLKRQAEELLREKTVYLDNVLQSSTLAIIAADLDLRIKYCNAVAEKFFSCRADEVIGCTIMGTHAEEKAWYSRFETAIETVRKEGEYKYVVEQKGKGGTRIIESRISGIMDNENKLIGFMLIAEDITERRRMEEELKRLSEIDPLTNIYNRRKFYALLSDEIERSERYERPLSFMMLDIDYFKRVNDTYGHDVGDRVLVTVADIVNKIIRKIDAFARLGGEEFAIIVPETEIEGSKALAEKIRKGIEGFSFNGVGEITISIGVTEFKRDDTVDSLLKRADDALYICKDRGRNRVEVLL